MTIQNIAVGSSLTVDLPPIRHHGVFLGDGLVLHNSKKNKRVCIDTLEEFSEGRAIQVNPPRNPINRSALLRRAKEFEGKDYSLLNFNCEHFVNEVLYEKPKCEQLNWTMGAAALGAAIGLSTKMGNQKMLMLVLASGLVGLLFSNLDPAKNTQRLAVFD